MMNEPDIGAMFTNARRSVAIAKLIIFSEQCHQIGDYAKAGLVPVPDAVDCLYDIAVCNNLVRAHGSEMIETLIAEEMYREVPE